MQPNDLRSPVARGDVSAFIGGAPHHLARVALGADAGHALLDAASTGGLTTSADLAIDRPLPAPVARPWRDAEARARPIEIRFVNTYRPVIPLYETVASAAAERLGWQVRACLSGGTYRSSDLAPDRHSPGIEKELVWVPRWLRRHGIGTNLCFSLAAPFRLVGAKRVALNVFLTHPPLFYVLGGMLSRAMGVPYVVHLLDLYPDILGQIGWLDADRPAYRGLLAASLHALRGAAGIVVIGHCMEERLMAKGIDPAKIHVVPTAASAEVRAVEHGENRFRRRFGLEGAFVVMYSGNMGLSHELQTLLSAAESLVDQPEIRFVFVGDGRRRALVQAAIDRGLPNVALFDYQTEGEGLAHSLAAADVHFVSLRDGYEGLVVPSKFYSALAAGRPVIYEGAPSGHIARIVRADGCGFVIRPGDVAGMRQAITSLHRQVDLRRRMGTTARSLYESRYDSAQLADAYCRALNQAIAPRAC